MTDSAPHEYAGPVSRGIAYGVDAVIVAVTFTGAAVVLGLIASVIGTQARDLARAAASAYLLVLPMLLVLYWALFWSLTGRTPGMALVGVRVVAISGRRMSGLSALVRAIVLAYFPLGAVWALVDRRRQGIHDKLAHTAVVRFPPSPAPAAVSGVVTQLRRG